MNKVKYRVYLSDRFSKEYKTSEDCVRLSEEEAINLIESYVGLSAVFNVRDWYGDICKTKFEVTGVEVNPYKAIVTITSDKDCPDRFFPTLYEICKENNVLGPISIGIIY